MGIRYEKEISNSGIFANYWVLRDVQALDFANKIAVGVFLGYKNKSAYNNDKNPIPNAEITYTLRDDNFDALMEGNLMKKIEKAFYKTAREINIGELHGSVEE